MSSQNQFTSWSRDNFATASNPKRALAIVDIGGSFSWPDFEVVRQMVNHLTLSCGFDVSLIFANDQCRYARLCPRSSIMAPGDRVLFSDFGGRFDPIKALSVQIASSVRPYQLALLITEGLFDREWFKDLPAALHARGGDPKDMPPLGVAITSHQQFNRHKGAPNVFDACLFDFAN